MKHTVTIIILLSTLLLSSCNTPAVTTTQQADINEAYNSETDDQPFWGGSKNAAATKYGYYFMVDQHLFLYDADSEKLTPLCGRPDCTHKGQADCNANFDGFIDYIGYL